jgi:hypothetical protein
MIYFTVIYLSLTILISYLLTLFSSKRFLKILIFSLSLSLFSTFWFKVPGESTLAPVVSIILLESTILEGNGIYRVIRPLALTSFVFFIISIFLWRKKSKN